MRLYHPSKPDVFRDVSERQARLYRRRGWTEAPEPEPGSVPEPEPEIELPEPFTVPEDPDRDSLGRFLPREE